MIRVCKRFSEDIIRRINLVVQAQPDLTRYRLSHIVCDWIGWKGQDGKPKDVSCRIAMLKLHNQGVIKLPPARQISFRNSLRVKETKDFEVSSIQSNLNELRGIEVIKIEKGDKPLTKLWTTMMKNHHYLGGCPLCGAQIRYLIRSEAGLLGGLSFSSAAWRLKPRDKWIGWSEASREANLSKVICNSRFLILPQVKVPNLASYILAKSIRQVSEDWEAQYGYAPVLLETFVDKARFFGTSYKASNWIHIGKTCGRGRQDKKHQTAESIKDIYLYPLTKNFREELCDGPNGVEKPLSEIAPPLPSPKDWVENELGGADLGDARLNERLLTLTRDFYARPQAHIPQACGSRAKTKAAYRFFDHPEITMDMVLKSHYESTGDRITDHSVVLAVQDTTSLNYSAHPLTRDLGPIGYQKDKGLGLIVHDTMAYNLEGTPLGLLDVQCWARDPEKFGKKKQRHQLPIEEKESNKWLKSFSAVAAVQKQCPQTTLVSVGDREADIYELFAEAVKEPFLPELLIRAEHNRALKKEQGHLWTHMEQQPVAGVQELFVPRQGKRTARTATLEVRFSQVHFNPPASKKDYGSVNLWAVWAKEVEAPEGVKPISWMLLTTIEVNNFEQACEKLAWYAKRWGIEIYHRTLKSGCKIETRQLGNADRIETCLAIDMVVAWRVYHLAKLGREVPDLPCTVFFEEDEWKALVTYVNKTPILPEQPPTLHEAMRMVAMSLGGFLGRKSDGEPGTKSIWLGLQRLDDITATWKILSPFVPQITQPTVSSKTDYG